MSVAYCNRFVSDILGALLLAKGVLTKSTFFVASQNLIKGDIERVKLIKQSCQDFKNTLLGLIILIMGFSLQILAQFLNTFSSDALIIFAILCWIIFGFFIKIEQQYRIDASIDFVLQRSSPKGVSKIINNLDKQGDRYQGITAFAGLDPNSIVKMAEDMIITDYVYGELRTNNNKLKEGWLINEIYRRDEASELPQWCYGYRDPKAKLVKEKSLLNRAIRSFIF